VRLIRAIEVRRLVFVSVKEEWYARITKLRKMVDQLFCKKFGTSASPRLSMSHHNALFQGFLAVSN
jgi:hypothetical protein